MSLETVFRSESVGFAYQMKNIKGRVCRLFNTSGELFEIDFKINQLWPSISMIAFIGIYFGPTLYEECQKQFSFAHYKSKLLSIMGVALGLWFLVKYIFNIASQNSMHTYDFIKDKAWSKEN